jgi:hypothetical protein
MSLFQIKVYKTYDDVRAGYPQPGWDVDLLVPPFRLTLDQFTAKIKHFRIKRK